MKLRVYLTLLAAFWVPAVASAHSGTVAKLVVSYWPLLLPFAAPLLASLRKAVIRFVARFHGKKDENSQQ